MKKKSTRRRRRTRIKSINNEINEEESLPIYKKLYPPLKDLFVYDENNEIENKLLKMKSDISKSKKKKNFLEDEDEMDERFLNNLVKSPCPIPKQKVIDVISKFIQKSKLIGKLEKDYESTEKKTVNMSLSKGCAEKLKYEEYETGEIIFKIGDAGDNFYFILSGNVSVLKLKEIPNIQMTYMEYIKYCIFLLNQNEEYLLNEVLKANESVLNVDSIEDIKLINKIVFLKKLNQDINKKITNNKQLKNYFSMSAQRYIDYDLRQDELDFFEQEKQKGKQGAGKEWEEYITKRCSLLVSEQVFFQSYENVLTDMEPKKIICYCYEPFLYLGPGLFFGDTALDFENNKRNATIRTEGKTYLAYLQRDDYLNIISPMNKMERIKEIEFLYTKYFFLSINSHIFEKNFFHLFSHREYYRGSILFSQGSIPRSLIFVKTGSISLELRCSIIDIQNLIKFIYDNIFLNPIFQRLPIIHKNRFMSNKKMANIKSYINDPTLMRLKTHNKLFIDEMKTIRGYTITILTNNEIIGLEEIFLRMPYITKASVVNSKVECYELSLGNLDRLLSCGRDIILSYTKYSMNKISTLIERLQNIKQNFINMSLAKFERKNIHNNTDKNLNINISYGKAIKEEIKNNTTKINFNSDNENNNLEKKDSEFNENKMEVTTKIVQKSSSPIKTFMTSLSPQSRTRLEEMKIAYEKMQKMLIKARNIRLMKDSLYYKNKKMHSRSIELDGMNTMNNQKREKKKANDSNNKTSSVIYNPDDKLNTKYLIEKLFNENKDEKSQTSKILNEGDSLSIIPHKYETHNRNKISIQQPITKYGTFSLNYIPLSLICENAEKNKNRHKNNFNNVNDLLTTNKSVQDIFSMKNSHFSSENLLNNDKINKLDSKSKTVKEKMIINNKRANFKRKLKSLNKNLNINNFAKITTQENPINIIPKKVLISGIIKDFYKDIKLNGYSSVIKNRKLNTIYMRKFNKKYDNAEKIYQNIKVQLLKENNSLPQIFG